MSVLKNRYWQRLFEYYAPIASRLTSKHCQSLQETLLKRGKCLDFTESNILAITSLVISKSQYYKEQGLLDVFYQFFDRDNLQNYKSNQKVLGNDRWKYHQWEYIKTHPSALNHRIIGTYCYNSSYRFEVVRSAQSVFSDLAVVSRSLGFDIVTAWDDDNFRVGELYTFKDKNGVTVFDIKFFKKGTYHVRLNAVLALRFNIAIGRLLGWLRSGADVQNEMGEKASAYDETDDFFKTDNDLRLTLQSFYPSALIE